MDDFLHNLRSGKLKQHDRSNRSYGDQQYKGGQRRGAMDRRKKSNESFEQMNAIKDLLESVSETQKRIAKAQESRAKSEERKADALEVIANHVIGMLDQTISPEMGAPARETQPAQKEVAAPSSQASSSYVVDRETENAQAKKLTSAAKKEVFDIVSKMRGDGNSWEKIARDIASRGYPTISGKGSWRGVMAKNLYEKLASE